VPRRVIRVLRASLVDSLQRQSALGGKLPCAFAQPLENLFAVRRRRHFDPGRSQMDARRLRGRITRRLGCRARDHGERQRCDGYGSWRRRIDGCRGRGFRRHALSRFLRRQRSRSRTDACRPALLDVIENRFGLRVHSRDAHLEALGARTRRGVVRQDLRLATKYGRSVRQHELEANHLARGARRNIGEEQRGSTEEREVAFDELLF
jgi:hypothetical protein